MTDSLYSPLEYEQPLKTQDAGNEAGSGYGDSQSAGGFKWRMQPHESEAPGRAVQGVARSFLRRNNKGGLVRSQAQWLTLLEREGPSPWPADQYAQPCQDCLAQGWTRATLVRSQLTHRERPTIYALTAKGREALTAYRESRQKRRLIVSQA
jgi:hypothetical protein